MFFKIHCFSSTVVTFFNNLLYDKILQLQSCEKIDTENIQVTYNIKNSRFTKQIDLKNIINDRNLLTKFSKDDIITLLSNYHEMIFNYQTLGLPINRNGNIKELYSQINKQNNQFFFLLLFSIILIVSNIFTNLFSVLLIKTTIFGFRLTCGGGIFIFPISFFMLDIITEHFGTKKAKIVSIINLVALIFTTILIYAHLKMSINNVDVKPQYCNVFSPFTRTCVATLVSVLFGYFVNITILSKLKSYTNLILRLLIASVIAEGLYSLLWVSIAMYGKITLHEMTNIIISNIVVKIICQLAFFPLTWIILSYLKRTNGEFIKKLKLW